MSNQLIELLARECGKQEPADCQLRFFLPRLSATAAPESPDAKSPQQPPAKRRNLGVTEPGNAKGTPLGNGAKKLRFVGEPLLAHKLVLSLGSEKFRAQLNQSWRSAAARATVLVSLGDEAEMPAALSTIRFIYTGKLEAPVESSISANAPSGGSGISLPDLLAVRRQAKALQVGGCVEACDKTLLALLGGAGSGCDKSGVSGGITFGDTSPVMQLLAYCALLPPGKEADEIVYITSAAKRALVAHFRSAPVVLRSAELQVQLNSLPAAGLEVLLAADDFATDDESSVLLLLAKWREANTERVAQEELGRLCGLVRVVQLGPAYLHYVLPELDWFPISRREHAFARTFAASAIPTRMQLCGSAASKYDTSSPWYGLPRAQALPRDGMSLVWRITEKQLREALAAAAADGGGANPGYATTFSNIHIRGHPGGGYWDESVLVRGLFWSVGVVFQPEADAASLMIGCGVPPVYGILDDNVYGTAVPHANVTVDRWTQEGVREAGPQVCLSSPSDVGVVFGSVVIYNCLLPLRTATTTVMKAEGQGETGLPAAETTAGAGGGSAIAATADPLWRWGDYLEQNRISGTITFVRQAEA